MRTGPDEAFADIRRFLQGVTLQLKAAPELEPLEECKTTVGCPAGWNDALRARYQALCEEAGLPNVTLTSESRAAFLYARNARGIAADEDFLSGSTLVIDIGSSTLDFAYVVDGRRRAAWGRSATITLAAACWTNVFCGRPRLMLPAREREKVQDVFLRSPTWRSHALYAARRVKEAYFTDEKKYEKEPCVGRVRLYYDGRQEIIFRLTQEFIENLPPAGAGAAEPVVPGESAGRAQPRAPADGRKPAARAGADGRRVAHGVLPRRVPRRFSGREVRRCPEPEFSIARGLAYAGRTDELLEAFRAEIHEYTGSQAVENAARADMPALCESLAALLTDLMAVEVAAPAAEAWRKGELATLEEMRRRIETESQALVRREETQAKLSAAVMEWLAGVQEKLQRDVDAICIRNSIPCEMMRLPPPQLQPGSALAAGAKIDFDAVKTVEAIIGAVVAAVMAALCGGAGLALVAEGPLGLAAGAAIGVVAALLGKPAVETMLMRVNLPVIMRKKFFRATRCFPRAAAEKCRRPLPNRLQRTKRSPRRS